MAVIRLRGAILLALVFFIAVPGALFAAAQPAASVTPAAQAAAIEAEAAPANAGAVHIEQALVTLPAIRVYLHPDQAPGAGQIVGDIRAELGRQALTVEGLTAFDAEREGMLYIFLVDVSGSLRTAQTAAIKAALKSFSRELTPADRLALIAFGENTDILLYGGESQAAVDEAVDALHNRDQNTLFYNGIWQALDLAGQERGYPERRAAIVISDGVDDTPGGFYTKEETVKRLAAGGLPFYGLGLQRRDGRGNLLNKDELDAFGEIIRVSQGAAGQVFDAGGDSDNLSLKLAELRDYTRAARVLALRAKSNFAAGGTETLRLSLGAAPLLTLSVPVEPANSLPDRAAPYVTGVGRLPAPAIGVRVSFSEALMAGGATGGGELAGDILPYVAVTDAEGR
ncbi:MAG: VWA domain-containing protein, partial [Peptococcaceae bacterium]|nr:VWA domain-containing protein [Peptococcaceae bacterium]